MSEHNEPERFEYGCPSGECRNKFEAIPVPNLVRCGVCGAPMEVYADNE